MMPSLHRSLFLLVLCLAAHRLDGQALARQDLALLDVTRGDARAQHELAEGRDALDRATRTGAWGAYQEAIRHFEEAALDDPQLAEPWFGLALSRLALYESGANALFSPTQPLGLPNRAAWASHIRAVLARDPRHLGALTSIGHVLLPQGERDQPAWVRAALARAESLGVVTPDLLLIHGRLAILERRYEESAQVFNEYVAKGGDRSIAALERARALAGTGDLDAAAQSYDSGLAVLTPEGLRLYRQDLAWITEVGELAGLETLSPADAPAWLRRFWLRRDATDVREEGDRLREHLRRWIVANERYRVVDPDRRTLFHGPWAPIAPCVTSDSFALRQAGAREASDSLDPRRGERILDDRGLMYLRHGDPLRVVWTLGAGDRDRTAAEAADRAEMRRSGLPTSVADAEIALRARARSLNDPGASSAEVWTYFIDGRVRSFLFRGSNWLGTNTPSTLSADISSPELALLRAQVDPRFEKVWARYDSPFPPKVPVECMVTVQRLAQEVRADLMVGGSSDDHPLIFPEPAIPAVQVAAVGDPATQTGEVVVAYAVPGHRLTPIRSDGQFVYPLRWRLTAVDSTGAVHRAEGDLMPVSADSLKEGEFLSGTLALPIPAGAWQVGVAIFQPDERRGGTIEARRVRLDAAPVALSDLILGRENDPVHWNGVAMNPLGTWRRGSTMTVFAELRGLDAGTEARATYEIRRLDRSSGRPAVRVASLSTVTGPRSTVESRIDLGRLDIGIYRLTLTVETAGGVRLVREKVFEVTPTP